VWTADDQPRRKVIYVDQTNNLFYKNYAESGEIISVTSDADENNGILNGIPDWVYEEEMLSSRAATWWSPNGQFIAYLKSYTKDIENIRFNYYGKSPDYRGRADDVTIHDPARVSGRNFNYVERWCNIFKIWKHKENIKKKNNQSMYMIYTVYRRRNN